MENAIFWDVKTQFLPHRKHIISPIQSATCKCYVRSEDFTVVTMKNFVLWDPTPCGSCKN
jgi:hypothetical protein